MRWCVLIHKRLYIYVNVHIIYATDWIGNWKCACWRKCIHMHKRVRQPDDMQTHSHTQMCSALRHIMIYLMHMEAPLSHPPGLVSKCLSLCSKHVLWYDVNLFHILHESLGIFTRTQKIQSFAAKPPTTHHPPITRTATSFMYYNIWMLRNYIWKRTLNKRCAVKSLWLWEGMVVDCGSRWCSVLFPFTHLSIYVY